MNDVINIKGSTNYLQTTNLDVENKIITLNKGSIGENTSAGISIQFRDNDLDNRGYIKISEDMKKLEIKMP